jgi:NADH-quinone oxidoreductase subunit C
MSGEDLQAQIEELKKKPRSQWTAADRVLVSKARKAGIKVDLEEAPKEEAEAAGPSDSGDLQGEMAALLAKPKADWTPEEKARFAELAKMGIKAKPKRKEEEPEAAPAPAGAEEDVLSRLPEELREFKALMDIPREKWTARERVASAKFKKAGITEETLQEALSQAAEGAAALSPELQEFKALMDLPRDKWTAKERVASAKFKKAGITEETLQEALSQAAGGPRRGPEDDHPAVARLKEVHWDNIVGIAIPGGHMDEVTVTVKRDAIQEVSRFLKEDPDCDMKLLSDLCGTDWPDNEGGRHCVVYLLYSLTHNFRLRLKVWGPEGEPVPSVIGVWRTADWHEREAYDLYGIVFDAHPDLRRILMPDWWEGFPLRKDYPFEDRLTPRERVTKETYDATAPYYLSTKGGEYPDSPLVRKLAKPGLTEYEGGPHGRPWEGSG